MDEERLRAGRDYLAAYIEDEDWHGTEAKAWFAQLAQHVMELPLTDPRLAVAAAGLLPFIDDDDRVDGAMYSCGRAVAVLEAGWGGDRDSYLSRFVAALESDHGAWRELQRRDGPAASWRHPELA